MENSNTNVGTQYAFFDESVEELMFRIANDQSDAGANDECRLALDGFCDDQNWYCYSSFGLDETDCNNNFDWEPYEVQMTNYQMDCQGLVNKFDTGTSSHGCF